MKKFLLFILLFFQSFVFGQDSLLQNLEFFIAPTHTWFPEKWTPDFKGKMGVDLGIKRLFSPERKVNFVYGLEFSFSNYYFDRSDTEPSHYDQYYTDIEVSKFMISNSFNMRFHFSSAKRVFIETGVFLDFNVSKQIKGVYHEDNEEPVFVRETVKSAPNLGFDIGFGINFPGENYSFAIKPDLKLNLFPQLNIGQQKFDNFTYTRLLLIIKKNK